MLQQSLDASTFKHDFTHAIIEFLVEKVKSATKLRVHVHAT